jgi:tetratricopeptide (TPR) repeat protein
MNTKLIFALLIGCASLSAQTKDHAPRANHATAATAKIPQALLSAEEAIGSRDFVTAETLLKQELAANPQDFRAYYDLGFVYQNTGREQEAVAAYKKSIAIDGTVAETHSAIGSLLQRLDRPADAVPHLQRAAELKPTADGWKALASAQEAQDATAAVESWRKAALADPKDAEPHLRAGVLYEKQKDWPSAEREYLEAQKLGDARESLVGLVNVYQQTKRVPEAIEALQQYLEQSPDNVKARVQLARLLKEQGRTEEARQQLAGAASVSSNDPAALASLALELSAVGDHAGSIDVLRKVVASSPEDGAAHAALGDELNATKDFAGAEKAYLQAARLRPGDAKAFGGLAIAASKNGHDALAIEALDARAKLEPENPGSVFLRAISHDRLKQYALAAESYHRFLELANGDFPDQEWQAKHRLAAIEPEAKKKR